MLDKIIKARFDHVIDLFNLTEEIDHPVEKGGFREYFISQLVRPLIPVHFGIGNGIIIDKNGKQSPQIDVLIYDKRRLQPIFEADNRGIYPVDSIMAVVEIKTKLTATELAKLEKTALAFLPGVAPNSLHIETPGTIPNPADPAHPITKYPLYSIFSYTSDAAQDEGTRIKKHCNRISWPGFRLIGVADKSLWSYNDVTGNFDDLLVGGRNFIITYLHMLLSELENTAKSRGDFGLQYWI